MRRRHLLLPLLCIVLAAVGGLAAVFLTDSSPELGLDLQGGVSVVLEPVKEVSGDELDVALEIIRTRVDALGVAEPDITRQGETIVVQLPGVENRERVLDLVGQTAELRFRPVLAGPIPKEGAEEPPEETTTTAPGDTTTTAPADPNATTTTTAPAAGDTTSTSEGALGLSEGEFAGAVQEPTTTTAPADPNATTTTTTATDQAPEQQGLPELTKPEDDVADQPVTLEGKDGDVIYMLGPTLATGRVVESASAKISQAGAWEIALTMRGGADGIDLFNQAAAKCSPPDPSICPNGSLAIVLDSMVQSAPSIERPSYERDAIVINGSFTESEAKDLALVLKYGSLPVELERQSVETVSASLGEDSLRAGIIAGLVGLGLVLVWMVLYYRALGLVVVLGLAVWGALLFTIISWLGASQGLALTLAGVTGIIVSIGVTGDSYIVYFERLKDEVKAGRTLRSSTERAFKRAFRTILTADASSFLGAVILWWLTVGSVRGFAFFLGLSTVLDVVVAWFFTRPMVTFLARNRVFTEARFLGVARGLAAPKPATVAPTAAVGAGK